MLIVHGKYMGWLRSVGSIKLYVSFAEYRLFYRALHTTGLCFYMVNKVVSKYTVISVVH